MLEQINLTSKKNKKKNTATNDGGWLSAIYKVFAGSSSHRLCHHRVLTGFEVFWCSYPAPRVMATRENCAGNCGTVQVAPRYRSDDEIYMLASRLAGGR